MTLVLCALCGETTCVCPPRTPAPVKAPPRNYVTTELDEMQRRLRVSRALRRRFN